MSTLIINEIFSSIQGETSWQGLPCTFVRLTGCNLRCSYCDTQYAYTEGEDKSIGKIISIAEQFGIPLVSVTGGEPLHQEGTLELIRKLTEKGFTLLVETNGSYPVNTVDERAIIIMDVKSPESGSFEKMDLVNLDYLQMKDELKFVLCGKKDYLWAKDFCRSHQLIGKCKISFQPVFGRFDPRELAELIIADKLPVRFQIQLHRILWNDQRGR